MTEPYRRAGRGGAGNFWSQEDVKNVEKNESADVESQNPSATESDLQRTQTALSARETPEYAHIGRGGAGNFHTPSSIPLSPTAPSIPTRTSSQASTLPNSSIPRPVAQVPEQPAFRGGRGGAGNFLWGNGAEEEERVKQLREAEEREREERLKMEIAASVEGGLQRPPGAVVGDRGGRLRVGN
ncbi:hypothetical protein BGZ60DRAFT_529331 [Tricladium varicosporioides]|nr:hypothetical protein BGZ60DRAFT_529331 [Hymenoscyphus varicosporioides]